MSGAGELGRSQGAGVAAPSASRLARRGLPLEGSRGTRRVDLVLTNGASTRSEACWRSTGSIPRGSLFCRVGGSVPSRTESGPHARGGTGPPESLDLDMPARRGTCFPTAERAARPSNGRTLATPATTTRTGTIRLDYTSIGCTFKCTFCTDQHSSTGATEQPIGIAIRAYDSLRFGRCVHRLRVRQARGVG